MNASDKTVWYGLVIFFQIADRREWLTLLVVFTSSLLIEDGLLYSLVGRDGFWRHQQQTNWTVRGFEDTIARVLIVELTFLLGLPAM